MVAPQSRIGVGLYSVADAARIVGAHANTVRRWLSERDGIVPLHFPREEHLLTFQELMEVHFIHLFRREGVSFQTIRKCSEAAAKKFDTKYPFTLKRFDTDGKTIFATLRKDHSQGVLIEDLERSQFVFKSVMPAFFRKLEYRVEGGRLQIGRYWPRTKRGRVVLDPTRKFGKPMDAETGVPTGVIYEALKAGGGQTPAVVARWLGIPLSAVNAACSFERSLA